MRSIMLRTGSMQLTASSYPDSQEAVGLIAVLSLAVFCRAGTKRLAQGGTCLQIVFTSALLNAWFILAHLCLSQTKRVKCVQWLQATLGNALIVIVINNCCLKCTFYHLLFWNDHCNVQTGKF